MNVRREGGFLVALLLVALVGLPACSDLSPSGPKLDSNSNWLTTCRVDDDCGDERDCICGVCTRDCAEGNLCPGLEDATCRGVDSVSVLELCGDAPVPEAPICLPECGSSAGCAIGQTCVGGACIVAAESREVALCGETGGDWDEESCGHWECGLAPACDAIVPGCNCGLNTTFDPELGCRVDPTCRSGNPGDRGLCEETGGDWDEASCGHYACGLPPTCEAAIPGCDCGAGANFFEGEGCFEDASCSDSEHAALCEETGGDWDALSCGHYVCGEHPACEAVVPGCNCGAVANFIEGDGCVLDDDCSHLRDAALCEVSGGAWDALSCGHYECGEHPACEAVVPGCNCGAGHNFVEGEGCLEDQACVAPPTPAALCSASDGRWDELTCGHYECGVERACEVVVPGCDCGVERNFLEGEGCVPDEACFVEPTPEGLCLASEGTWVVEACGHYVCGEPGTCDLTTPGCDCGENRNFAEGDGCVATADQCAQRRAQALCDGTDGTWLPESCGHWECGQEPVCGDVVPGCNCGLARSFFEVEGCAADATCL